MERLTPNDGGDGFASIMDEGRRGESGASCELLDVLPPLEATAGLREAGAKSEGREPLEVRSVIVGTDECSETGVRRVKSVVANPRIV